MNTSTLIALDRISRHYQLGDSRISALDAISLRIVQGEFIAIMGPSGSGKSTFMNIVGCLDTPTSGTYLLEGRNVGQFSRDELAAIRNQKIGFVFQGFNLLARTPARENVELPMLYNGTPAEQRRRMAHEALRVVGLEDRRDHHPNQLSGGQQQRLAIARAIVNRPSILMADEPTGNLDSKTSQEIMRLFVQLNVQSGITVIVVTHEPDIAEYARRRIRFLDGRIVSDQQRDARD